LKRNRNQSKKILLISGYKRAGKDFVSSEINKMFGGTICSFAYHLKHIVANTLDIKMDDLDKWKNEELDLKAGNLIISDFRTILQRFGTDAMKMWFGDDVWVELFTKHIPESELVIVSDFRFKSEYEYLTQEFDHIFTIRVNDDNIIPTDHISERDLDDFVFDVVIDNTNKGVGVNLSGVEKLLKG